MKNNQFFDYEKLNFKTMMMLMEEYAFNRENRVRTYFLKRSNFCAKSCINLDKYEFNSCHQECISQLFKRNEIIDFNQGEMFDMITNANIPREIEQTNESPKSRSRFSQNLDFPEHMFSDTKSQPDMKDTSHQSLFARNKGFSGKNRKNKLFTKEE
jgi:hypothetical protein